MDSYVTYEDLVACSTQCCPICFEEYKSEEDVALSRNQECHHIYHVDCIVQWLVNNDECPMCRCKYLVQCIPSASSNAEDGESFGNVSEASSINFETSSSSSTESFTVDFQVQSQRTVDVEDSTIELNVSSGPQDRSPETLGSSH